MKKLISVVIVFSLILPVFGCGEETSTETFFAMDTVMTVTAYGNGAKEASAAAYNEIKRIEKLLSVTEEQSEIYVLNHRLTADVSAETAAAVKQTSEG